MRMSASAFCANLESRLARRVVESDKYKAECGGALFVFVLLRNLTWSIRKGHMCLVEDIIMACCIEEGKKE